MNVQIQAQAQTQMNPWGEEHAKHSSFIPIELQRTRYEDPANDDPYDFMGRFVSNQKTTFRTAVNEIKNGKKETHWFWFVLPTSPYIVNGVEQGSRTNRYFTLRSDEEVLAYLEFEAQGVSLRKNYLTILSEIKYQMKKGKSLDKLFPPKDTPKAVASFCLFERVARENSDHEVFQVCYDVLALHEKTKHNLNLFQKIRNKLAKAEKGNKTTPSSKRRTRNNNTKLTFPLALLYYWPLAKHNETCLRTYLPIHPNNNNTQ